VGELSRYELWYGRDEPPVERRELRAGPLTMELEGIDLRYVRLGDIEVVRRLYAAVRDPDWGTIQPIVSNLRLDVRDDSFMLGFDARHAGHDIDFRWKGELAGRPDGTITYSLDGTAESDFSYNRIGFCILHPAEAAGCRYRARTPDGDLVGELPDTIGPQLIVDGLPAPLFPSFDRLEIEPADGLWARFELEGDLFEIEDQRNWTDASFKTYSTPLRLGFPHAAEAGQGLRQHVRLSLEGAVDRPPPARGGTVRIDLGGPVGTVVPPVGLGLASHGGGLSEREAALLRALAPAHVRADLDLESNGWAGALDRAADETRALGAALELALFLGDDPRGTLDVLARRLRDASVPLARVLVFRRGEPTTAGRRVRLARERLGGAAGGVPFVGGTNVLFTDLNRFRPELEGLDGLAFPLNATVHAADDLSVIETPAMHAETVRSARSFCDGLPIHVGPVTFNQRFNPVATGPEPEPAPEELPPQVDPRQMALLGAGWTLASLKHLAESGAASVTYFETTGWRGVLETEAGSPVPQRFPSRPGTAFPLYHVLADASEWRGAEVLAARSSTPLAVEALAVAADGGTSVLLANLTPAEQQCLIGPLPQAQVSLRRLDETTFRQAGEDPAVFRARREQAAARGSELELLLAPYAVVRVDPAR
jgi:hypothetical protein